MPRNLRGSLFGGLVLLGDLVDDNREVADDAREAASQLGQQDFSGRDGRDGLNTGRVEDVALNEAALDVEAVLVVLGVLRDDAGGRGRVGIGERAENSGLSCTANGRALSEGPRRAAAGLCG